jgi:hypothetical protein
VSVDFRTEPINAVAQKYRSDLTVMQAAAEIGRNVGELQEGIRKSRRLIELGFGQLLIKNGGIKRDVWHEHFHDVVQELDPNAENPQASAHGSAATHYEGFAYTAGSIVGGLNGGFGSWGGPWDEYGYGYTSSIIRAGSLTFGDLQTSGNSIQTTSNQPIGHGRQFASPPTLGTPGTPLFISFLVRPIGALNAGHPYSYFLLVYGGAAIGKSRDSDYYSIAPDGGGPLNESKIRVAMNQTVFLVARLKFADGPGQVDLWVNPTPGHPLPATPDATMRDKHLGSPSGFNIGTSILTVFDEIRFGGSWEAVSPVRPR